MGLSIPMEPDACIFGRMEEATEVAHQLHAVAEHHGAYVNLVRLPNGECLTRAAYMVWVARVGETCALCKNDLLGALWLSMDEQLCCSQDCAVACFGARDAGFWPVGFILPNGWTVVGRWVGNVFGVVLAQWGEDFASWEFRRDTKATYWGHYTLADFSKAAGDYRTRVRDVRGRTEEVSK
jgi:hypothetical protein